MHSFSRSKQFLDGREDAAGANAEKPSKQEDAANLHQKTSASSSFSLRNTHRGEGTHVKRDVSNHKPKIAPMVFVENVKAGRKVRVRRPHAAELAVARRVWVGDVSACDGDVPIHVLRACLSQRRIQAHELDGRASDVLVADGCRVKWLLRIQERWRSELRTLSQDAFDEIRVW